MFSALLQDHLTVFPFYVCFEKPDIISENFYNCYLASSAYFLFRLDCLLFKTVSMIINVCLFPFSSFCWKVGWVTFRIGNSIFGFSCESLIFWEPKSDLLFWKSKSLFWLRATRVSCSHRCFYKSKSLFFLFLKELQDQNALLFWA